MTDNSSKPWAIFYKQAKNNAEDINNALLKHLENLDKDNVIEQMIIIRLN
jgi:hypothetical protein